MSAPTIRRGTAPLILSIPHAGTDIPAAIEARLVSPDIGRLDTDWHLDRLYAFAADQGVTVIATPTSRTVVDVNRDPSGQSLYPGQATTELCPTTTFAGQPLYRGDPPDAAEIEQRREMFWAPYHAALAAEVARLRALHPRIVLYDAHSIRSVIPRLFDGLLSEANIGTDSGRSCDPALTASVREACTAAGLGHVVDGRFKGGFITRHHGRPSEGVHAIQMELAMRTYLDEPDGPAERAAWPPPYDPVRAAPMRRTLSEVLQTCLTFATVAPQLGLPSTA